MVTLPFATLSPAGKKRAFVFFFCLTLAVMTVMNLLDVPLRTAAAPSGIVSFELAGQPDAAQRIVASWDDEARIYAALSLGIDYLFMLAYSTAVALGCVILAQRMPPALALLGPYLAWAQWIAALLDAVENYSLIRVLLGTAQGWATVARYCALPKFAIIGVGLLYLVAGALLLLWQRLSNLKPAT